MSNANVEKRKGKRKEKTPKTSHTLKLTITKNEISVR